MGKIIAVLAATLISLLASAQDFQGIAVYESKISLKSFKQGTETNIDPVADKEIYERVSKAMEKTYTLYFDKSSSVYEEQQKLDGPMASETMFQINFSGISGKYYKNLKNKTYLQESDVFGKEFLISDSLRKRDWKLENETRKIGNYTCYKATHIIKAEKNDNNQPVSLTMVPQEDVTVTAWYTPEIPVSNGPGYYWGLPGLILEANDGHTTLLCSKLTLNPKEKFTIKPPKKGEKVTQAQFDKIMEKKMLEMQENAGPDRPGRTTNRTMIRIGG